jgi:hypothetical protein
MYGFEVEATDGEAGTVVDFYVDPESWALRYVVLETGAWLVGRRMLISPEVLHRPDWEAETLRVSLTRQQIEDSPQVDLTKPVSSEQLEQLHAYYGWPWWGGPLLQTGPTHLPILIPMASMQEEAREEQENGQKPRLRSAREIIGYRIRAKDGHIGHCADFFVDTANWLFHYAWVDTGGWLPGRKVLVATEWIETIRWLEREIEVDLDKEAVRDSPEYDFEGVVDREYEEILHQHYRRRGYWQRLGH